MAALAIGDNVLVTLLGDLHGQTTMSTFGYVVTGLTGDQDDGTAFGQFRDELCAANKLVDKYFMCVPTEWEPRVMWIQRIRPTRLMKRVFGYTNVGPVGGFESTTANLAAVVLRRGGLANKKNISTLHVPLATEDAAIVDGEITNEQAVFLAELGVQMKATYITDFSGATFSPSILNGPLASNVTPIIETFVKPEARVMRRRTKGYGI